MRKRHEDSGELSFFEKIMKKIGDFWYDTKVDLHELLHDPDKPKKAVNAQREKKKKKWIDLIFIWSVLIVPIILTLVFWVYGTIISIPIAFEQYSDSGELTYGLYNFKYIINAFKTGDILFEALFNTLKYFCFNLFVQTPLSYLVAYFLYKKIRGNGFFRYVFFIPSMVSSVIISSLFMYLVGPGGPIQELIGKLTNDPSLLLLRNSDTAFGTMLFYNLWVGLAGGMIMNLAAFTRIPTEVIEAGVLDGVNIWLEIRYLILPLTWPFFGTMLMLQFIGIFGASGPALLLTGGAYGTYDMGYYIYTLTVSGSRASQSLAGAIGLLTGLLTLPLALFIRKLVNKIEPVEF